MDEEIRQPKFQVSEDIEFEVFQSKKNLTNFYPQSKRIHLI